MDLQTRLQFHPSIPRRNIYSKLKDWRKLYPFFFSYWRIFPKLIVIGTFASVGSKQVKIPSLFGMGKSICLRHVQSLTVQFICEQQERRTNELEDNSLCFLCKALHRKSTAVSSPREVSSLPAY